MIHLTTTAIAEIRRLQLKYSHPVYFRLGIQAGGCADWYYTLEFDEKYGARDYCFDTGAVQVIVGKDSLTYVKGLTIDYSEDLMGGGFRFHNSNAIRNCGCGNSFAVEGS
ncbi:MAG: iron-sulfur cluster assembly accessory protein [Leptolyngbyaceae cyanobacterium SL_7_1]|nr:iron-sulfur cluster assembly accessory protein [Leptolyngbyaceae cyanobacterium SL_7_1]